MGTEKSKPIRVLKPGTYTSVEGVKVTFSLADLEEAAASYDFASDPAPLVIGHPQLDKPAYGWAKELRVEDGELVADPDPETLDPAFAEIVNAGRYRRISGRFYQRKAPANPKPGHLYLQHIGFLGAAAPAVKGLGVVNLADGDGDDLITIQSDEREISMSEVDATITAATTALEARSAELDQREQQLATREQTASAALHASNLAFADRLVAETRLLPAGKGLLVGLLDTLDGVAADTVSFGEADKDISPADALRKLLSGAQPIVSLGEAAPGGGEEEPGSVSFAAPAGFDVDAKRLEIHSKALELQAADSSLSYLDAVKRAGG
ncbi:MAG TPA: hypothetical protein VEC11_07745 [Allosphingosinicella sp.]|nr:hypothetical protein [Allosphingosinicella sp.]